MFSENLHSILQHQVEEFIGDDAEMLLKMSKFIDEINATYAYFENNKKDEKSILPKYEAALIENAFLTRRVKTLEERIEYKKTRLEQNALHLENAEKIGNTGSFKYKKSDGFLVYSYQLTKMFNLSELVGDLLQFTALFKESTKIEETFNASFEFQKSFRLEDVQLKDDDRYFVLVGEVLQESDEPSLLVVVQDVTYLHEHERELRGALLNLEFYKNAIDQTVILSLTNEEGKIIFINDKFTEISGYSNLEVIGKTHGFLNSGDYPEGFFESIWDKIQSGENWHGVFKNKSKNGEYYWVDTTIIPFIVDEKIVQYVSLQLDITDKVLIDQKLEEQRLFYEMILNNLPIDIAVFNNKHQYLFVNQIGIKNPEVRNFLIGKDDYEYCLKYNKDPKLADARREIFNKVVESKKILEFTDSLINSEGNTVYVLRKFFPFLNDTNELEYMLGVGVDVTETVEQSLKIEESLIEKEALLGEVHHRVKNNLSIVLGLIEMQISRMKDHTFQNEFYEIKNRILAMSLIHEKLYKSSNFADIDLKDYLYDLVHFLNDFFNKDHKVKIEFELEQVFATTKKTVPIALLVNEMITNMFKHAFNNVEHPKIKIELREIDREIELTISDNGIGLPADFDLAKMNSLGFKLIQIFIKQLKAKQQVNSDHGLSLKIQFENDHKSVDVKNIL